MRSMQFAGTQIARSNSRIYNCGFINIENFKDFGDVLFMLFEGVGCGISVQKHTIEKLPVIKLGFEEQSMIIKDERESWSNSIVRLLENPYLTFDYSNIRPRGSSLSIGGTASGPE